MAKSSGGGGRGNARPSGEIFSGSNALYATRGGVGRVSRENALNLYVNSANKLLKLKASGFQGVGMAWSKVVRRAKNQGLTAADVFSKETSQRIRG